MTHSMLVVFPACAGMFRPTKSVGAPRLRFPRVRGDVPPVPPSCDYKRLFSPRARGCSDLLSAKNFRIQVFPACAGMFRCSGSWGGALCPFSPRARGCSLQAMYEDAVRLVFPACAGMFLVDVRPGYRWARFPRVRGDVPC